MFLKYLDIFGFKSFADRTHIEFADGITALLGPNGCGKSNVVDAIKWVLGEQAAKTMRADKMEDVIFNGTEKRPALGVAEVTLTISNEKNLLPLDVSEITIKRRLYRSGESEYYINNIPAKLKDVRELFWDTGVGKAAYSVMEQGKIDQVLSSKPEDRRYLFEEAAGITRFKVKRAEAERKLEKTEENMKQLDGILGEVAHSYETLKVQAEKTIKWRELKDKIFDFELDIQLLKLKNFNQDYSRKKEELETIGNRRTQIKEEIDQINQILTENMDKVNEMQKIIHDMEKEMVSIAIEKQNKDKLSKVLVQNQKEIESKVQLLESRKAGLEEKIESLQEDIDEKESDIRTFVKRIADIEENIKSFEDNITAAGNKITENDLKAAEYEEQIKTIVSQRSDLEKDLESITEDIVTELDSKLKDAGYSSSAHTKALDNVTEILKKLNVLVSGRKNIFSDFTKVSTHSEEESKKITETAVTAFVDIEKLLTDLESAVETLEKTSPAFIDDFLSPEGIITQKRKIDEKIQQNKQSELEKKQDIEGLKTANTGLAKKIEEYRETLENLRLDHVQMKTQKEAAESEVKMIHRDISNQQAALHDLEGELFEENKRLEEVSQQVLDIEGEISELDYKGNKISSELTKIENECKDKSSDLTEKQQKLKDKNIEASKIQSQYEECYLSVARAETEIRNLKENFSETHSRDLMEFEERMFTITSSAVDLKESLNDTKQQLKDLGSVNLMAPEEFNEIKERYDFLTNQMQDLQKAKDDLQRITDEIRAEATELFLKTYNLIKKNFHNMFRRLFGGGRAELHLVDPQNVLESGIEIFAQPPGKKLESIALLSGGEKTMTAVALLFATYRVRPSPFCLLDEIDAALDEQNVFRFVDTLREFANVSQYIIITHNKKTVTGASSLLGITMGEEGISKAVTIKLENENGSVSVATVPDEEFQEEDVAPEENVYIPPRPPKRNHEVVKE